MVTSMNNSLLSSASDMLSGLTLAQNSLEQWLFRNTGKSALGNKVDSDFMFILWLCVFSFVFLMFLMVYWCIKYRRRPGVAPLRSPSHNTPLEIAWTIVPTIFLAMMFFRGFWIYLDQVIVPGNAIELRVMASKWNWSATYPGGVESLESTRIGAQDIPVFYVPANTPIHIRQNSADVMHAFYVPDFRIKFDVLPNRYTNLWFESEAPDGSTTFQDGEFKGEPYEDHWVFCAEYCGDNHSEMAAIIRTVSPDVYARWYQNSAEGKGLDDVSLGKKLYTMKGCVACHTVDGGVGTGPTWQGIYNHEVELSDGSKVIADDNYIRESILVPAAKVVKGFPNQMTSYQGLLNDKQLEGLIAYIKSLSPDAGHAAPAATPAAPDQPKK